MKKILGGGILLFGIIGILLFATYTNADTKTDVQNIVEFVQSEYIQLIPQKNFYYHKGENKIKILEEWRLFHTEQLAKLEGWRYNQHFLWVSKITYKHSNSEYIKITVHIKEKYDALSPNSHTYVEWVLIDSGPCGKIHRVLKEFNIIMENYQGEDYNIKLLPQWPEGLLNRDFLNPSKEIGQKKYEEEITYWMEILKDYME